MRQWSEDLDQLNFLRMKSLLVESLQMANRGILDELKIGFIKKYVDQ